MADVNQSEILGYKMKTPEEFFDKARIIAKQLDWMAEKGYESHPITGNEPTYEDRMNNEPVAWGMLDSEGGIYDTICPEEHDREEGAYTIPLFTHPAKTLTEDTECQYCKQGCIRCDARKLLTDEEIAEIAIQCGTYINEQGSIYPDDICIYSFARAILKKASEK